MSEIKRYRPSIKHTTLKDREVLIPNLIEQKNGSVVLYSDVKELEAQVAELKSKVTLEEVCEATEQAAEFLSFSDAEAEEKEEVERLLDELEANVGAGCYSEALALFQKIRGVGK